MSKIFDALKKAGMQDQGLMNDPLLNESANGAAVGVEIPAPELPGVLSNGNLSNGDLGNGPSHEREEDEPRPLEPAARLAREMPGEQADSHSGMTELPKPTTNRQARLRNGAS